MKPVIKKNLKAAIIIYYDPDLKDNRRVVFGETDKLIDFFIREIPILWKRISKLAGKDFDSPQEFIDYYYEHKEEWAKLHGIKAGDNLRLDLTYQVKDVK